MRKGSCTQSKNMLTSSHGDKKSPIRKELLVMSDPVKNSFRGRFTAMILTTGFTRQKDAAEYFKVDPSTIRAISYGDRMPSEKLFYQMWSVFGNEFPELMKSSPAWGETVGELPPLENFLNGQESRRKKS